MDLNSRRRPPVTQRGPGWGARRRWALRPAALLWPGLSILAKGAPVPWWLQLGDGGQRPHALAFAPMPWPSPVPEGPAPSSPQRRWEGCCHLRPPVPAGLSCPALALPVGAEGSSLPSPGSLPPVSLRPHPTWEAASLSPADPSPRNPGHGIRSVDLQQHAGRSVSWLLRGGCCSWFLQGLWGSPLLSLRDAVLCPCCHAGSDSCTWGGAWWEFLLGLSWPKVTRE